MYTGHVKQERTPMSCTLLKASSVPPPKASHYVAQSQLPRFELDILSGTIEAMTSKQPLARKIGLLRRRRWTSKIKEGNSAKSLCAGLRSTERRERHGLCWRGMWQGRIRTIRRQTTLKGSPRMISDFFVGCKNLIVQEHKYFSNSLR